MNPECKSWEEKLSLYADGELNESEDAACSQHLRVCPSCNEIVFLHVRQKRLLQKAAMHEDASARLRARVMNRGFGHWFWTPGTLIPQTVAFAAVALIIVGLLFSQKREESNEVFRTLTDLHTSTLAMANPVEVASSDKHTVKPWFQGKVPFSFELPDPANGTYTLLGGRMAFVGHAPAAQLIYAYKLHRVSVFIFAALNGPSISQGAKDMSGIHEEAWMQGDLQYVAVGDASPEALHGLAAWLKTVAPKPAS